MLIDRTCEVTVAGRRVEHVLGLSDRLQVRQGRGDHLTVAQRQIHHLVVGDMAHRDGQYGLCNDSWGRGNEKESELRGEVNRGVTK